MSADQGDRKITGGYQPDDDRWARYLQDLVEFVAGQQRWPRPTGGATTEERRLGQWLSTQRRELGIGALSRQRKLELDRQLPGWH
ncbi:helicase associated domain-containing protein [Nakamurella alba]